MELIDAVQVSDLIYPDLSAHFFGNEAEFTRFKNLGLRHFRSLILFAGKRVADYDYRVTVQTDASCETKDCFAVAIKSTAEAAEAVTINSREYTAGTSWGVVVIPAADTVTISGTAEAAEFYLFDEVYFDMLCKCITLVICRSGIMADNDLWEKRAEVIERSVIDALSTPTKDSTGEEQKVSYYIRGR